MKHRITAVLAILVAASGALYQHALRDTAGGSSSLPEDSIGPNSEGHLRAEENSAPPQGEHSTSVRVAIERDAVDSQRQADLPESRGSEEATEDQVAAEGSAQEDPEFMVAHGGPEDWAEEYKDAAAESMLLEAEDITRFLKRETHEELKRRRVEGEFEVLSTTGHASISTGLNEDDASFFNGLDLLVTDYYGTVKRYRVPEDQYPELWHLGRKARWLEWNARAKQAREVGMSK